MRKEEFAQRLHDEMAAVRVDEQLRRRTLLAMNGKEQKPIMKRKISAAVVFALLIVAMCAVALAVAGQWGILDFVGRYADYIPEDAMSYMESDVAQFENEVVDVNIRELYYDGRTLRFMADVTPKDEKALLVGTDCMLGDNWQNLFRPLGDEWNDADERTIRDVFVEQGYETALNTNVWIEEEATGRVVGGSMAYTLVEDGTLTIFRQIEFEKDLDERDITISVSAAPYTDPLSSDRTDYSRYVVAQHTIHLTAAQLATSEPVQAGTIPNTYICTEPVVYESIGVQLDRLLIEVKPQEIYATIEYSVIDREKFERLEGGLWFEFVDPQSTEESYYKQRLEIGLSGGGGMEWLNEEMTKFRQKGNLARNELHETYTVRAYSAWEKDRFDTHTLTMRPATAADMDAE